MLILKICPTPFFSDRGCHVRILEQTRALQELGHQVRLCTYHCGRNLSGIEIYRIRFLKHQRLEAGPDWRKYFLDLLLFFKAAGLILKKRPRVIHAHLHEGAFIGFPLARIFRIPIVLDLQGSLTDEMLAHRFIHPGTLPFKLNYWLEKKACQMSDKILASSINLTAFLENGFGLNGRVKLIEEGLKIEAPEDRLELSLTERKALRKRLGIPEAVPVILYLGLLYAYQGIDDFLGMARKLLSRRKDIHFLIIGFPREKEYEKKIREEGLGSYFTFAGKVRYEEISLFISLADIAVSPKISRTESNSKLYHFMAQGLPTLVYDLPVNHRILGEAGIYVEPGDREGLTSETEKMLGDERGRAYCSIKLRERARSFKDWLEVGREIEEVYNKLCKE